MSITNEILTGQYDTELDALNDALRARREILQVHKRAGLRVGDFVVFNDTAKPTYLRGLKATIARINPKRVVVDFPDDAACGRFRNAKGVSAPVGIVEKVTA